MRYFSGQQHKLLELIRMISAIKQKTISLVQLAFQELVSNLCFLLMVTALSLACFVALGAITGTLRESGED